MWTDACRLTYKLSGPLFPAQGEIQGEGRHRQEARGEMKDGKIRMGTELVEDEDERRGKRQNEVI